jgi:predicted protein tyrosine phosphatase
MPHQHEKTNLLFICTANHDRSPTAEDLFRSSGRYKALSAGILPLARREVSQELIDWADIVFVMNEEEDGHASHLRRFDVSGKKIVDLNIPDVYPRGSEPLLELLRQRLSGFIRLDV